MRARALVSREACGPSRDPWPNGYTGGRPLVRSRCTQTCPVRVMTPSAGCVDEVNTLHGRRWGRPGAKQGGKDGNVQVVLLETRLVQTPPPELPLWSYCEKMTLRATRLGVQPPPQTGPPSRRNGGGGGGERGDGTGTCMCVCVGGVTGDVGDVTGDVGTGDVRTGDVTRMRIAEALALA